MGGPVSPQSVPSLQSVSSQSPAPVTMTPVLVLLLTAFSLAQGVPDIMELEMDAFELCESDKEDGLTWEEVEDCEEEFGEELSSQGITVPTEEDFNAADLNNDGTLLFAEWKEWVGMM